MTKKNINKVYIQTVEAKTIYDEMYRKVMNKSRNYSGLIPNSLELIKLLDIGLETRKEKSKDKWYSDDIINVKFSLKAQDISKVIEDVEKRIVRTIDFIEGSKEGAAGGFQQRLEEYKINKEYLVNLDEYQLSVSLNQLRKEFYANGFTLVNSDGEIIKYKAYKRSGAKSRTGEMLFIREELYETMIQWSRMYLPFKEGQDVDLPSLLAYESLVTSSIESTVKINPKNILLIDDMESSFKKELKAVIKNEKGELKVKEDNITIKNNIWDGQSLLDESIFESAGLGSKGMMLLRQGMFKSAAFNTRIQDYLQSVATDEGVDFDSMKLTDMYGNKILAKNVKMITTPSSLKVLKFAGLMEGQDERQKENNIYKHWIQFVKDEGFIFGVCKTDKPSKFSNGDAGEVVNRFSYQMINSMNTDLSEVMDLMGYELSYIEGIKNDVNKFIKHLDDCGDFSNTNAMYSALYAHNPEFEKTKLFRDFKKTKINSYIKNVKSGKVKIENADYCVLFGNPDLMLKASHAPLEIMGDIVESKSLIGNEVYCKLFNDGDDLVGFRSPHSSPSNILVAKNKKHDNFKWFNLTNNIVCINSTDNEILDTLSGSDFDSDTMLLVKSHNLHEIALKCKGYKVVRNEISASNTGYKLTKDDSYQVDKKLSKSKTDIGEITNLCQAALSIMWGAISEGEHDVARDMLEIVDICTVLSGISIDEAKKSSGIVMSDEIKKIRKVIQSYLIEKKKPLFFKSISKDTDISSKVTLYNTPMDYLQVICDDINNAIRGEDSTDITELMVEMPLGKGNNRQEREMICKVRKVICRVEAINTKKATTKANDSLRQELHNQLEEAHAELIKAIPSKMSVETMYDVVMHQFSKNKDSSNKKIEKVSYLLNALYQRHPRLFLSIFK